MAHFMDLTPEDTLAGIKTGVLKDQSGEIVPTEYGKACAILAGMKTKMDILYSTDEKPSSGDLKGFIEASLEVYKYLCNEEKGYDRTSTPLPV